MSVPRFNRLLLGLVLAIALPGIACFGWYSLDSSGITNPWGQALVVLAYPMALVALAIVFLVIQSRKKP